MAQQAGLLDLQPGLGDLLLYHPLRRQRAAERFPLFGPRDHHGQGSFRRPERAHAVMDTAGPEPHLGRGEAAPLLPQYVADRDPDLVEADFAVAVLVVVAEHRIVADDGDAGSVPRH